MRGQAALHFATQELSSFHCDVSKDRLYNDARDGREGRAARTALWLSLRALLHTVAPIVPHLAEDVFVHLPPACRAALPACVPPTTKALSTPPWLRFRDSHADCHEIGNV